MVTCARSAAEAVLAELRAQVVELRAAKARLREVIEAKDAQLAVTQAALDAAEVRFAALSERVTELKRRSGKDSSTSSRPPSSDSPYQKKPRDRSLRRRTGRKPGKQPGAESSTGGCWRTLTGLADFALVQSYLSTTANWGISKLDALRQLFTTGPWLPPAITPP